VGEPLQLWVVEPSGLQEVPWDGHGRPLGESQRLTRLGVLRHRAPGGQRRVYVMGEGQGARTWRRQTPERADLTLPRGQNPRLEALGSTWSALDGAERRLEAAERWFRSQPFEYTLQPERLPSQAPLDTFLFQTRRGFCGHYASAFTALMRASGVPARVVSGYHGGEWVQPLGGSAYLELRQAEAHAWSEVWIDGEGWRRVDPSRWLSTGGSGMAQGSGSTRLSPFHWLQRQWWGLDLAWTRFWLGFDRRAQEELLERLLGPWAAWSGVLAVIAVALCLMGSVAVLAWLRRKHPDDPWRRELDRLLATLERHGEVPLAGETLSRYVERLGSRWPELTPGLRRFTRLYEWRRFGQPVGDAGDGGAGPGGGTPGWRALRRERRQLGQTLRRLNG
jgi:hypothetical protein